MNEHKPSATSHIEIVPAGVKEYERLSVYHYRGGKIGPFKAIYAIVDTHPVRARLCGGRIVAGVIVYSMPAPNLELRNVATGKMFRQFGDRKMQLQLVNENIRCISRVIIDPRYRGIGLASMLVKETMPKLNVPIIEALAVMGKVNPFFEKAGMKRYEASDSVHCVRLGEALGMVGIDEELFTDPTGVLEKVQSLAEDKAKFIESEFINFLQAYGKRRNMAEGVERMQFVLGKLATRPAYYIWKCLEGT